eukprot:13270838-Ditylum_brightwellii.AAC.1
MKSASTSKQQSNPDVKRAVIAFQRPSPRQLQCSQFHTYKLRTTPSDATSPIYELSVPFFNKGTPEEWIEFCCRLQAVLKGQNVTQGPPSYTVAKTLLKGNALTVFEQAENTHGWTDPEALHTEEYVLWQRNHREGMSGLSFGIERLPQGFSRAQRKPNTAT